MNCKSLVLISLFVVMGLTTAGCGGKAATPAEVAQAPALGFTPADVCEVPDVVGLDQTAAEGMLVELGLQPVRSNRYDPGIAVGAVISQDPPTGTRMEPCQGDVTIVVSLGPMPGPSPTPAPTNTPEPTKTPTLIPPTLTPTNTPEPTSIPSPIPPTPTPTPDPRLFWDDFETGIKPEWGMSGNGFASVNGQLVVEDGLLESQVIGDSSWRNYKIKIYGYDVPDHTIRILIRVQDRDNYMSLDCRGVPGFYTYECTWHKVINGEDQSIPGSYISFRRGYHIELLELEIQDNVYRTSRDGEQWLRFVDDTFNNGGFQLQVNGSMAFEGFEVLTLP